MLATRDVTLVFEPTNAHSSVPMIIQKAAGFSHVKLIIKEPGNGTNWQYDIWKDGKDSIGFGDEKGNAMRWHGLRPGETEQFVDKTTMTDDQIKKAAKDVIKMMGGYNLILNNCHVFATELAKRICIDPPSLETHLYPGYWEFK